MPVEHSSLFEPLCACMLLGLHMCINLPQRLPSAKQPLCGGAGSFRELHALAQSALSDGDQRSHYAATKLVAKNGGQLTTTHRGQHPSNLPALADCRLPRRCLGSRRFLLLSVNEAGTGSIEPGLPLLSAGCIFRSAQPVDPSQTCHQPRFKLGH